ncbi:MAG TPA: hypothetical protein VL361_05420 [Candidatus Limnocylindrales bacterium]|nr:hypothetical protein [Candidatus Limnocylindrales bacterium]
MKWFPASIRFKVILALSCLFLSIVIALVCFSFEPKPAPFLILQQPFSRPLPLRDQLVVWIPTASSWLPQVEDALLGRRAPVNVFVHIITLPTSPDEDPPCVSTLGRPTFATTNGLHVWLLRGAELMALRDKLKGTIGIDFISHPRISTADGVEASLYVGESVSLNGWTNEIGLRAAFFPRVHKDLTDLIAMISFSELITNQSGIQTAGKATSSLSIRTNLDIAARLQVPKGDGIFISTGHPADIEPKRFGVLIEPP